MAHAWDDGGKEADRAEVLEAPAALEEDSAEDRAGVSEVPEVSEKDSVADRAGVSEASVVSGGDRVMVPAFVAYRTDSTENRAAGTVLAEVLAASAVGLACAYDHRRYPA